MPTLHQHLFIFLSGERQVARVNSLLQEHNNLELSTGVHCTKHNTTRPTLPNKSSPEHSWYTSKPSKNNFPTYSLFFARLPEEWTILSICAWSGLSALWACQEKNSHYLFGHTCHSNSWENSLKNQHNFPLVIKCCTLVTWRLNILCKVGRNWILITV